MDLYPTTEQRELVAAARAVTRASSGADVWVSATRQGWLTLGLTEDAGGLGGSLADEAQLYAEIGASAVAGPVLATSTAVRVAAASGRPDLVELIAEGRAGHAFATSGTVVAFDARDADVLLLVDEDGGTLRLVPMTAAMLVADLTPLDPAVTAARVDLSGGEVLAEVDGDTATHELSRAALLVAAMLAGIANAATDLSVAHAGLREQFGKPIGAFQAISHRCADMAMRARAATAVTDFAAVSLDEHHTDALRRVAAARRHTEMAALENTRAAIQVHGATGFTWEHDAHRLLKRATFLAASFLPRGAQTEALTAPA